MKKKPKPIAIEKIEIDGECVKSLPFNITRFDDGSISVTPDIYRLCTVAYPMPDNYPLPIK